MNGRSKGMLAAMAALASSGRMDQKEAPYKFNGLMPKNTEGRVCGYEPPKEKLRSKLVRQGPSLSLKKRKKLLARLTK